jgi:hypothetical protein
MPFSESSIVAMGPIQSELLTSPGTRSLYVQMGHIATFGGDIKNDTPTVIEPHALFVEQWMRGHGIGCRLLKTLVFQARQLGVETIKGHIESQYSLDICAEIFGSNAIRFFHDSPDMPIENAPEQYKELPISFWEARDSLIRAEKSEDDLDYRSIGFDFDVDISTIDLKSNEWNHQF